MSESLTSDLWLKIDQLHLKYLQSEDNPIKLEIRKKLEGLVRDYLSLVPLQRKFVSPTTGDIIGNSAKWKPDFSLLKAAEAFKAIEQYAANLINQPWRQEFWSIRQYSGFYKHSVETALFGAEKMFLEMGYSVATGQPQVLVLPQPRVGQHPVNTDHVTSVARDCVLACVECQMLSEVHNSVSLQFPTMLEEVIEFRRDHIGSVEVCVRELLYRKNQLRYQHQFPPMTPSMTPTMTSPQYGVQNYAFPAPPQPVSNMQPPTQTNGYAPVSYHTTGPVYGGYQEYPLTGQPQLYGQVVGGVVSGQQAQHHSHHSPAGSSSTCTLRQIPTTILELAQQQQQQQQQAPEPVAPERRGRGDRGDGGARPRERKESRSNGKSSRKSGVEQDFDSWDYVYKHLEQTGYTKDQAERPDVLESSQSDEELRRNIQDLRINRNSGDGGHARYNGDSHHHHRRHKEETVHHHHPRGHRHSRVETSESEQEQDNSRYSSAVSEDTLQPRRYTDEVSQQPQRQSRGHVPQHQQQSSGRAELWECSTCTFHNKQTSNICEMCSKSRDFRPDTDQRRVEPAAQPRLNNSVITPSEGVSCSKCTLVNSSSSKLCEACGATLPKTF